MDTDQDEGEATGAPDGEEGVARQDVAPGGRGLKLLRRNDARKLADEIRRDIGRVRRNLLRLYEGRGWEALGYASWRQCVGREFKQAQSHMYRLLDAARINHQTVKRCEGVQSFASSVGG